jgi:hypothetical protein
MKNNNPIKTFVGNASYIYLYDEDGILNIEIDYTQEKVGGKLGDDLSYWEALELHKALGEWISKHSYSSNPNTK